MEFLNKGFTIKIWSILPVDDLSKSMEEYGIAPDGGLGQKLWIESIAHNPGYEAPEDEYSNFQSQAHLVAFPGTGTDQINKILQFIRYGKEKNLKMETKIDKQVTPFEKSSLADIENLDIFFF